MSLIFLIAFGIPLVALVGQIVGGLLGFVVTLSFHGLRALLRYIFLSAYRRCRT